MRLQQKVVLKGLHVPEVGAGSPLRREVVDEGRFGNDVEEDDEGEEEVPSMTKAPKMRAAAMRSKRRPTPRPSVSPHPAYQPPRTMITKTMMPTSTRLQEKKLRELGEGTGTRKSVRWGDEDGSTANTAYTPPLSARLQAKMLREMESEDPSAASCVPGSSRIGGSGRLGGMMKTRSGISNTGTAVIVEEKRVPGLGVELDGDREADSGHGNDGEVVAQDQAWLSGARATRATRKALDEILRQGSKKNRSAGEVDEPGEADIQVDMDPGKEAGKEVEVDLGLCDEVAQADDAGSRPLDEEGSRVEDEQVVTVEDNGGDSTKKDWRDLIEDMAARMERRSTLTSLNEVPEHAEGDDTPHKTSNRRSSSRIAALNSQPPSDSSSLPPPRLRGPGRKKAQAQKGGWTEKEMQEELYRMKLGYPRRDKEVEKEPVDFNAKNPVEWETSLGKQVWERMKEMKEGC